jgi:small ligand-binding sensory domain FIST
MKIATAGLSRTGEAGGGHALAEHVRAQLGEGGVDLCLLLASAHFEDEYERLAGEVHEALAPRALVGMTGETVVHDAQENEGQPGAVLWAARLPGAHVQSFHLLADDLPRLADVDELRGFIGAPADAAPSFLLLSEPFSFGRATLAFLELLNAAYPGRPALGGLASAGEQPGQNLLLFEGQVLRTGLVGVALWGAVELQPVVSQGCRPIGGQLVVTSAEQNVIRELGGRAALTVLTDILRDCRPRDLELARTRGLLIGRAISDPQVADGLSDYLIRNPIDFDQESGAIAINDIVREGETVQFHVRDGVSADEDLEMLLLAGRRRQAAGALLFSCNGRGTRLFSYRHHDARAIVDAYGALPVAGLFCAGEIGPVGDRNYLHGHTACIGILRAPDDTGGP